MNTWILAVKLELWGVMCVKINIMNTISVCCHNITTCMHTIMGKHEVMHAQHEGTALYYDCTHNMRVQLYI